MRKAPIIPLKKAFKQRREAFCLRASSIFPIYISKNNDTFILFLNYWSLKNKINKKKLLFVLKIRNTDGHLVKNFIYEDLNLHNQISIKKILEKNKLFKNNFKGTVEFELISTQNLRFPFPAITVVYKSDNLYSAVHSAGRIKNHDEDQKIEYSEESNWKIKISKDITPFFHYFNGPSKPIKKYIEVKALNKNGKLLEKKNIDVSSINNFGSRTFYIDKLFKSKKIDNSCFFSVLTEHNSIYPRLVVGNFFKKKNFHEVTHSYPVHKDLDYCKQDNINDYQSTISGFTSDLLGLKMRSFPNYNKSDMITDIYIQKNDDNSLEKDDGRLNKRKIQNFIKGKDEIILDDNSKFLSLCLKGKKVPNRMTISYQFYVKNKMIKDNMFSTDISDGSKSSLFPPKYTYWGHGIFEKDFDTCIFLRNKSHSPKETKKCVAKLTIFSKNFRKIFKIRIQPESIKNLVFSKLMKNTKIPKSEFCSWIIKTDQPTCDTFWLCYNTKNGNVFGDHGF